MIYRNFGNTGVKVSALGFGCMRFPIISIGDKKVIDEDKTVSMLQRALELGINYFDTAYFYGDSMSEVVLGKALNKVRKKVYISTKCHSDYVKKPGDLRKILEHQLKKLNTDYIDFYHLHGLRYSTLIETEKRTMWLEDMMDAKGEGLIGHISFSTHDLPENTINIIDTGIFETMLCQYNLIDRRNEDIMTYASSRGLGVAVMGPLGGGRIAELPGEPSWKVKNNAEAAFRFVFSHPAVDCVLSGMTNIRELEENEVLASEGRKLEIRELEEINSLMEQKRRLANLYCTGCSYCMPCPSGIDIPSVFKCFNYFKVYGLERFARQKYMELGQDSDTGGKRADACTGCGRCEKKCPQNIEIRRKLKESHRLLYDSSI